MGLLSERPRLGEAAGCDMVSDMVIERWRTIAEYLSGRTGLRISDEQVRKWSRRRSGALPVSRFMGRVFAHTEQLDAWIVEQQREGYGR